MKRYKQTILSHFFVASQTAVGTEPGSNCHLVEANLDIESRGDRTLCTEVLCGEVEYQVLTNELLPNVCPICTAILKRRIRSMSLERTPGSTGVVEETLDVVPDSQLSLTLEHSIKEKKDKSIELQDAMSASPQIELFL